MFLSLIFYVFLLLICTTLAYYADKYNSKKILYLIIFIFTFVTGFRGEDVGIDTVNYIDFWDEVLSGNILFIELGFQWLIEVLQKVTTNYVILFFTCSFIIYFFIIIRLWELKRIASFSILIATLYMLVLMPSMNTMRQYCAISILFYSTRYLFNKKYLRYFGGIIVATLLHTSSLLGIVFGGFDLLNWRQYSLPKKIFFVLLLLLLPFFFFKAYELAYTEYGNYFESGEANIGLLTLLKILFISSSYYFSKIWLKVSSYDSKYIVKVAFSSYLIGTCLESLGYFFPYMDRIGLVFSIWGILYWGILFKFTNNISLKYLYFMFLLVLIGLPFLLSIINNGYGTVPYSLCW